MNVSCKEWEWSKDGQKTAKIQPKNCRKTADRMQTDCIQTAEKPAEKPSESLHNTITYKSRLTQKKLYKKTDAIFSIYG